MYKINLNGREIKYQFFHSSKTKNIGLKIKNNEIFLIIPKASFLKPKLFLEKKALNFLESKKDWILKHIKQDYIENKIKNPDLFKEDKKHYLENKQKAKLLCTAKCKYWSSKMNLQYNNISVKSLKTRWGSCSSKKNLNFSYKIIFLKPKDIDYLIVHELSHLKHMNHSKNFWDLVCETLESEEFRKYRIKF